MKKLHLMYVNKYHIYKFIALVLGYCCWLIFAEQQIVQHRVAIPIAFYNAMQYTKITAPETINVQLQGMRRNFYHAINNYATVHLDARTLSAGDHKITVTEQDIFLRNNLHLLNYEPQTISLNIEKV